MDASMITAVTGRYQLTLRNITRNWMWSDVFAGSLKESAVQTAECIVEWPPGDTPASFSDFGVFTFEGCKADNKSLLTYPRLYQFTINSDNTVLAEPSDIIGNSDFSIIRIPE
jgi:hypothetical protein